MCPFKFLGFKSNWLDLRTFFAKSGWSRLRTLLGVIHLVCQYSQQNPKKEYLRVSTASLKNSTDMSLPSACFSNYAPLLRRAKFGFEVPNLMLLWFGCGCQASNIFDGTKYKIILYDYYVESFFAPSRRGDLEKDFIRTLPMAQHTQGIEYFDSISTFSSKQKLQQALISWSN